MTYDVFISLLFAFSILTSLFVEAVKNVLVSLKMAYASNILVLCLSVIVGGLGTVFFYICNDIIFTAQNVICIFLMVFANWLVSMLGYDKVMQAIAQMKGGGNNG